jgi:hypothetical protein
MLAQGCFLLVMYVTRWASVSVRRCDVDLEVADPGFTEASLMDLSRFRGTSTFTGMHRTYACASVLVATKPAELTAGLRMLEVCIVIL